MATAAQIRSNAKYDKEHTTGLYLKFNNGTDKDILEYLKSVPNKQGFIKELIRQAMNDSVPKNELLEKYTLCHDAGDYLSTPDNAESVIYLPMSEKKDNKKLVYGVFELIGTVPYK